MSKPVLTVAVLWASLSLAQVPSSGQTPVIPSTGVGDVALFINVGNPQASRVIGTDSIQNGLFSFTLDGGTAEYLSLGPMRGVDAKSALRFRTAPKSLLLASAVNVGLYLYSLNDAGVLVDARARPINLPGVGAVALDSMPDGGLEAWLDVGTSTLRRIAFFEDPTDPTQLDWVELTTLTLPRSVSGLVVDSRNRRLYASISVDGIYGWRIDGPDAPALLEGLDGGSLRATPSGLALYPLTDGGAVMLVATAPRDEFVAYQVTNAGLKGLTSFQVSAGNQLVRGSRYVDVSGVPTPEYPLGVVVMADQNSTTGANYKLVRWDTLADSTDPKLPVNDAGSALDASVVRDSGVVVIGNCPDELDAGTPDGGFNDGGASDAGLISDGGLADAGPDAGGLDAGRRPCTRDAGSGPGPGPGPGSGGGGVDPDPPPKGCCVGGPMSAIFPGSFLLLWTLSFRRRKT